MKPIIALAVAVLAATAAHAFQPTGSLRELYDPALLPLLRPGVKAGSFSSYDRTGGNNDGFSGTYSKLREEDGNSVLAEMEGPGAIQRIWFTHSEHKVDGLLERMGEHIRVYIDGAEAPALDVPLEQLFDGSLERFPKPLVGSGIGGFFCYVPIPYTKSCKVVVDGLGVRFYQINYSTFPSAEGVKPFAMALTEEEKGEMKKAVERWSDPLSVLRGEGVGTFSTTPGQWNRPISIAWGKSGACLRDDDSVIEPRPVLVVGFTFEGELGDGTMEICQGGVNSDEVIRMPLSYFFGTADGGITKSLFMGKDGIVYYNLLPFYLGGEGAITVTPRNGTQGTMKQYTIDVESVPADAGRLSAQINRSIPTVPDVYHPFLKAQGQGHYAGTYLVTEGPKGLPYWLEGDDRWTIDGELRIHGTGSEDYFNCGWYAVEERLNGPGGFPSHGFPVYGEQGDKMHASAYRWHLADPVPFDKEITAEIEHGEANKHVADYRSVGWYYVK